MPINKANYGLMPRQDCATPLLKDRGFTLIEVIIALFVVSLALVAAVVFVDNSADSVFHLNRKTFAHWVAMNHLTEEDIHNPWPAIGRKSGQSQMAGQTWYWHETVSDLPIKGLRQTVISVRRTPTGTVLAKVRGIQSKAILPFVVTQSGHFNP